MCGCVLTSGPAQQACTSLAPHHHTSMFPTPSCRAAASGAYIFRVNSTSPGGAIFPVAPGGGAVTVTTATGAVVNEARLVFAPWASAVFRLWKGSATVDVEYTIGPIPIDDQWGKEVRSC